MTTELRTSQVEVLRAVRDLAVDAPGKPGYGAGLWGLAHRLDRTSQSVEGSLGRLEARGYVEVIRPNLATALYCLTQLGHEALEGEG